MDDKLWRDILEAFEREAGEPPAAQPEGWELCLLARIAAKHLGSAKGVIEKMEQRLLEEEPSLESCREMLTRGLATVTVPIKEANELVSRSLASRSRSPRQRRELLQQAQTVLQKAGITWKHNASAADVAAKLLLAGRSLPQDTIPCS